RFSREEKISHGSINTYLDLIQLVLSYDLDGPLFFFLSFFMRR
ncbi:hypothetical protein CSUI_008475, partial [Cystoisospora suis]